MKPWSLALFVTVPFFGAGCGFAQNIRRNVVLSPLYSITDRADHHRHEQMAREAFKQMALAYPDHEFCCDYREGFVDGFTDYLDYGGSGEPPPIPPPGYRLFGYMTPEGLAAMEDWKKGFRHGASTARASNLRDLVTIPVYWGPKYPTAPPVPLPPTPDEPEAKKPDKPGPVPEPMGPPPPPPEPVRPK